MCAEDEIMAENFIFYYLYACVRACLFTEDTTVLTDINCVG